MLVDCDPKLEWFLPPSGSVMMEYTSLAIRYDETQIPNECIADQQSLGTAYSFTISLFGDDQDGIINIEPG